MPRPYALRVAAAILVGTGVLGLSVWANADRTGATAAIKPTYDKTTGKLTQLSYDSDHDGRADTWTDMDGTRPLRSRIDRNGDGKVDRWEEYRRQRNPGEGGVLQKRRRSCRRVGVGVWRERHSTHRDVVDRRRAQESIAGNTTTCRTPAPTGGGVLVRVEEDTAGDGSVHKWETYRDGTLETVAFDEDGDGKPDRRLTYRGTAPGAHRIAAGASGRFTKRTEVKN